MSNKTNEEKLRILQERLAQIKQKEENSSISEKSENIEIEITEPDAEELSTKKKKSFFGSWIFKSILLLIVLYSGLYIYNTLNNTTNLENKEIKKTNIIEKKLTYNLDILGNTIAIIETFEDENSAKAVVNDLRVKGFKSNYFYLPNKSNSNEKVYKVFIGPYENEEETNQWIENLDKEISIINVNDGSIIRNIKSSAQIQMEKEAAEKERLAQEAKKLEEQKLAEIEKLEKAKQEGRIEIAYTYNFTLTDVNKGFLSINNNAKYPRIKQIFKDINSNGGVERIVKNTKSIMESNGTTINGITFEKSGTIVDFYEGNLKSVSINQ